MAVGLFLSGILVDVAPHNLDQTPHHDTSGCGHRCVRRSHPVYGWECACQSFQPSGEVVMHRLRRLSSTWIGDPWFWFIPLFLMIVWLWFRKSPPPLVCDPESEDIPNVERKRVEQSPLPCPPSVPSAGPPAQKGVLPHDDQVGAQEVHPAIAPSLLPGASIDPPLVCQDAEIF